MFKFSKQFLPESWRLPARWLRDERGLEALQVVMILAVAAVCLQVIKYWWPWWREFLNLAIEIFVE